MASPSRSGEPACRRQAQQQHHQVQVHKLGTCAVRCIMRGEAGAVSGGEAEWGGVEVAAALMVERGSIGQHAVARCNGLAVGVGACSWGGCCGCCCQQGWVAGCHSRKRTRRIPWRRRAAAGSQGARVISDAARRRRITASDTRSLLKLPQHGLVPRRPCTMTALQNARMYPCTYRPTRGMYVVGCRLTDEFQRIRHRAFRARLMALCIPLSGCNRDGERHKA